MPKHLKNILNVMELYSEKSTHELPYSTSQLGPMSIERVLDGHEAIYLNEGKPLKSWEKNILVFCDPIKLVWSISKANHVIKILQFLRHHNFTIYQMSDSGIGFEPITDINGFHVDNISIESGHSARLLTMSQDQIVDSTEALKKIPRSKICFLDSRLIPKLLSLAFHGYCRSLLPSIHIKEFLLFIEYGFQPKIINQKIPRIFESEHSQASYERLCAVSKIHDEISQLISRINYTSLSQFSAPGISYHPEGVELVIEPNNLQQFAIDIKNLPLKVKIISLHFTDIEFVSPYIDLETLKNLENLTFYRCTSDDDTFMHSVLPQIRSLSFIEGNPIRSLSAILNKANSLEHLNVNSYEGNALVNLTQDDYLKLEKLETVDFSKSIVSSQMPLFFPKTELSLEGVIVRNNAENKRKLKSNGIEKLLFNPEGKIVEFTSQHFYLYDKGIYEKLKKRIQFDCIDISRMILTNSFAQILSENNNINTLIADQEDINELELPADTRFDQLKTLTFVDDGASELEKTELFIARTSVLENLTIMAYYEHTFSSETYKRLANLKTLNLSGFSGILAAAHLLQHLPRLEELTLGDINFAPESLSQVSWKFHHLHTLTLEGDLGPHVLSLLSHMSVLKHLKLEFELMDTNLTLVDSFPKTLESLEIDVSGWVSDSFFENILMILPKLKILKIRSIGYRRQDVKNNNSMRMHESLEELDISDCMIPSQEKLSDLLSHLPNLQRLFIVNRSDLDNFMFPPGLTKLKIVDARGISFDPESRVEIIKNTNGCVILREPIFEQKNTPVTIDTNTTKTSVQYSPKMILKKKQSNGGEFISPSLYLSNVYDRVNYVSEIVGRNANPFILLKNDDTEIRNCSETQISTSNLFELFDSDKIVDTHEIYHLMGSNTFTLSSEWQPLESITYYDVVLHLSVFGLNPDEYQFRYSNTHHQYQIKSLVLQPRKVTVQYIIQTPKNEPTPSPHVGFIIDQYNSKSDELPKKYKNGNGRYWVDALKKHRAGACRHKAIAFFDEMEGKVYNRNYILNETHAFVMIQETQNGIWVKCDLGGYAATVTPNLSNFTNTNQPVAKPPTQEFDQNIFLCSAYDDYSYVESQHIDQFVLDVLSNYPGLNKCIDFQNNNALDEFQKLVRQTAIAQNRPLIHIDSVEDLHFSSERLIRNNHNQVEHIKGLGGNLYEFLTTNHPTHPIILVNWNRFSKEEIVAFNSLMDKSRNILGLPVPANASVIGLYNSHRPDAYKSDDFTGRMGALLEFNYSANEIQKFVHQSIPSDHEKLHVYLHQCNNWKSILCGNWKRNSAGWFYDEGPFITALESHPRKNIVLHDCPLSDSYFQNFVNQIQIEKKITIGGKDYAIPEGFISFDPQPYPLALASIDRISVSYIPFNPRLFFPGKTINPINFSKFFSRYQLTGKSIEVIPGWLDEFAQDSTIELYFSHPLTRSQWSQLIEYASRPDRNLRFHVHAHAGIYLPSELQIKQVVSTVNIAQNTANALTICNQITPPLHLPVEIDCSDLNVSDLFGTIAPVPGRSLEFTEHAGAVNDILNTGRDLILKGSFSEEIEQSFYDWGVNRQRSEGQGRVFALWGSPSSLMHYPIYSETPSDHFIQGRLVLLLTALNQHPLILLTGPTGVGKTTFILEHLSTVPGMKIFNGLESIDKWMSHPVDDEQQHILFIDEANITEDKQREWTEFAGLLKNSPPQIIIKGKVVTLTNKHKVVFAGNPNNYGGERHESLLFKNYPVARVNFLPLPSNYLIESVLNPILAQHPEAIIELMRIYDKVREMSGEAQWVTPRELTHMAHLYLAYFCQVETHPLNLARACGWMVARQAMPVEKQALIDEPFSPLVHSSIFAYKNYCVTESRLHVTSRLNEMLFLRKMKMNGWIKGGLNGLVLEGEPGTGKSEHVIAQLESYGLKYYKLPVGLSYNDKKTILLKADQENAIVICDEINSSPAMEKLLNDILSRNSKFLLILTQNPANKFSGRRPLSEALDRRLMHCQVSRMPSIEMVQTLVETYKLPKALAEEVVKDFDYSSSKKERPLSFRVLVKNIESAIEHVMLTFAIRGYDESKMRVIFQALQQWKQPVTTAPSPVKHLARVASEALPDREHVKRVKLTIE